MEEKRGKTGRVAKVLVILTLAIIGMLIWRRGHKEEEIIPNETVIEDVSDGYQEINVQEEGDREEEVLIGVHVSGAVRNPDQVYFLPVGSRVFEAIEAAGGAASDADLSVLNLAEYLMDGAKIHVPAIDEITTEGEGSTKEDWIIYPEKEEEGKESSLSSHLTNINEASKIELISLPGIGESLADRIIAYREENGEFLSIEDIKNVSGIGDSKFQMICDLITVD